MDTEQLTEEQLYYKEKYFKYKLKYLTLKEELEGGGLFSSKKTEPANSAANKPATDDNKKFKAAVTAVVATKALEKKAPTEKKVSSSNPDEILTFLRELLDPKYTEKTIRRLPEQRWDTANTNNYKIKKLIDEEMGGKIYNLSKFEDIENMLSPVLKTANMKGYLVDIRELKKYLRHNLKKKFFT